MQMTWSPSISGAELQPQAFGVAPVVLHEIPPPRFLAGGGVEAEEVAHRAEVVDLPVGHRRRGARAGRVADGVLARILELPDFLAGGGVQAEQPFRPADGVARERVGRVRLPLVQLPIGDVHLAVGDRRPGVARADRRPPFHRQFRRQLFDHPLFAPNAVPLRTVPLRPVVADRRLQTDGQSAEATADDDAGETSIPGRVEESRHEETPCSVHENDGDAPESLTGL